MPSRFVAFWEERKIWRTSSLSNVHDNCLNRTSVDTNDCRGKAAAVAATKQKKRSEDALSYRVCQRILKTAGLSPQKKRFPGAELFREDGSFHGGLVCGASRARSLVSGRMFFVVEGRIRGLQPPGSSGLTSHTRTQIQAPRPIMPMRCPRPHQGTNSMRRSAASACWINAIPKICFRKRFGLVHHPSRSLSSCALNA